MVLKSFGCSFIFGNELHDDGHDGWVATPSQHTWPALLAHDMNLEYQCYANPGSGNLQILEHLLNQLTNIQPAVYVIGWSWIDRFDYIDSTDQWSTIMPTDTTKESEFYYKNLHSQYRDKFTTLMAIKIAIDTLKSKNQKFIMTCMDDLTFEDTWHSNPSTLSLQDYIRPYVTTFEGKNFLDWSFDCGYPIGPIGKHPLEEAHRAAFELIKSHNLV